MSNLPSAKNRTLRAGFGRANITPPPGLEMSGFSARTQPAEGTHDPLLARVLVVQSQDSESASIVLISLDLIGLSQKLVVSVKQRLAANYGLDGERVLLACTHTHGGPATLDYDYIGRHDEAYLEQLPDVICQAVEEALSSLSPAWLYSSQAPAQNAGRNRNVEGGPVDPVCGVLAVRSVFDDKLLGVVVNYTCHPTVLGPQNLLYTADYPFYTAQTIATGTGLPVERILFTNGACGNINAGHTAKSSMLPGAATLRTYEAAEQLGSSVGRAALQALKQAAYSPQARLEVEPIIPVGVHKVRLDWNSTGWPTRTELESFGQQQAAAQAEFGQRQEQASAANAATLERWASNWLAQPLDKVSHPLQAELSLVRLGRLVWLAFPGELYVELGLQIKEQVKQIGDEAWILGYTNGDLGYFPTPAAFERADYEAAEAYRYYGQPAPFTAQVGVQLVEEAINLLTSAKVYS